MGTPAKPERYPEVICFCRVIPNLCSHTEHPLGTSRGAGALGFTGELCGFQRVSFLMLKVKFLLAAFRLVS